VQGKEITEGRPQVTEEILKTIFTVVNNKIHARYSEKGWGISVSRHEIYGILKEEEHELIEALQTNNSWEFFNELLDIAVAAIHGMASIQSQKMDW